MTTAVVITLHNLQNLARNGAPGRIRTCDHRLRRPVVSNPGPTPRLRIHAVCAVCAVSKKGPIFKSHNRLAVTSKYYASIERPSRAGAGAVDHVVVAHGGERGSVLELRKSACYLLAW